ncbi:OsmC family protein [Planococcus halotolerans]|uniref:OsmC family peroxiredoxin n=1 Tax=Planococcus halotolerans TaxID=2233542 RepID=A0A365KJ08_9BACL|nr:OsmC family protein [Planococcus halotolerans]QHJ71971.1 OsmC family peroxiredoxin [Planococcus halotolerans]RAZ73127.1 OsmC family peroxiredoxin [Planococcus halotolerans]
MKFSMTEHGFSGDLPFGELSVSTNEEHGFRPYQLLVASLAVCSAGIIRKVLEKQRMPADDIQAEVKEIVRIDGEAGRVSKVHLHFLIKGEIDESKMPRVMELTRKNCSMVRSVENSIEVVETYEIV